MKYTVTNNTKQAQVFSYHDGVIRHVRIEPSSVVEVDKPVYLRMMSHALWCDKANKGELTFSHPEMATKEKLKPKSIG